MDANASTFSNIIADLRKVATVPVVMDSDVCDVRTRGEIVVECTKVNEIVSSYDALCTMSHKSWSNLPQPPVDESTHVFIWMIVCRGYTINHSTIMWPSSSPNTFVHLWSILDRMKSALTSLDMTWLMGSRTCVDYCTSTGMDGPMDTNMYVKERVLPDALALMKRDEQVFSYGSVMRDYVSYMDFHVSTQMPEVVEMLKVSQMYSESLSKR